VTIVESGEYRWVKSIHDAPGAKPGSDAVVVVSCDTHIGPLLSDLRQYCPKKYLEDFDDFAKAIAENDSSRWTIQQGPPPQDVILEQPEGMKSPIGWEQAARNQSTSGHHDMHQRIRDMDAEGIAGEVIFHGSQNSQPIPFVVSNVLISGFTFPFTYEGIDRERTAVGLRIYNQWLSDACSVQPERHVGLAAIPAYDPEMCVKEAEWAADHGLGGISLPAIRPGMALYDQPEWEPFWATVAERGLVLANHVAAGDEAGSQSGIELTYHSVRLIWRLMNAGVFERYPRIKLVICEALGSWWQFVMYAMDSMELFPRDMEKLPSEYAQTNVFHGATFIAREEVETAIEADYWQNVIWGSDYPHMEGTWQRGPVGDEEPQTHLHFRDSFAGLPKDKVVAMIGGNACEVYGFDRHKLQEVANGITAPTWDEIDTPLGDDRPSVHGYTTFRNNRSKFGQWKHS
jgi:predicted TIM-barrel fold metal-dependent hydrolase